MYYKEFTDGAVFTADDANDLQSAGRILVNTAADLPDATASGVRARQRALALDTGLEYELLTSPSRRWEPLDTGWVTIATGIRARRHGVLAEIRSTSAGVTGTFPAQAEMTLPGVTVPAELCPSADNTRGGVRFGGGGVGSVTITTGGQIVIANAGVARTAAAFSVFYFLG